MEKRGSITVFLSLILTLLFSFVLTSLEAARLEGARTYLSMLSSLAGDSFLASYYFPLFEEYGLLGVDAGYGTRYLSQAQMEETLRGHIAYATESMEGGLLELDKPKVDVLRYETLFAEEAFLGQVKKQAAYEGLGMVLEKFLDSAAIRDSAAAGELYQKQQVLQKEATDTVRELLKLMMLVDGISTGEQGILPDERGNPETEECFIKQLAPMTSDELRSAFGNDQIYHALESSFFYPQEKAEMVFSLLESALLAADEIDREEERIDECEFRLSRIPEEKKAAKKAKEEWKQAAKEAKEQERPEVMEEALAMAQNYEDLYKALVLEEKELEEEVDWREDRQAELERQRKADVKAAKPEYESIRKQVEAVLPLLEKALAAVESLEVKQKAAQSFAWAYEAFLEGKKPEVSSGLYETFLKELETMKLYLNMKEQGYSPEVMRKTLTGNLNLLREIKLPVFHSDTVGTMYSVIGKFKDRIGEYSLKGLWFAYGEVKAGPETGEGVKKALQSLLESGICGLVGITEQTLSEAEVSGTGLPSSLLAAEKTSGTLWESVLSLTEKVSEKGLEPVADTLALELYLMHFFSDYKNPKEHTRLAYEREYILFGQENDRSNLTSMILSLTAFRTLFTMSAILQNPEKQTQISTFAAAIAGFTGIPLLVSVIKYALLLLWSLEEAIVEVAALLMGKRMPLLSRTGNISVGELLQFSKEKVRGKAEQIKDSPLGMKYSEYVLCLSLLEGTRKKCYRAMDLIQENIRLRYRDSFRIRNVITELEYQVSAELKQKWSSEVFFPEIYRIQKQKKIQY